MAHYDTITLPDGYSIEPTGKLVKRSRTTVVSGGAKYKSPLWVHPLRSLELTYPAKNRTAAQVIKDIFLITGTDHTFRVRDPSDYSSALPNAPISMLDQNIGTGNGVITTYQITKKYTQGSQTYTRNITYLRPGILVAVNGVAQVLTTDYTVDLVTGIITFVVPPPNTEVITCGYYYDIKARFTDEELAEEFQTHEASDFTFEVEESRL